MVELNDIYSNINNNKVFLDLPESFEIDYKEKEDVFNNINFKSIMNYKDVNFIKNNNNIDLLQNLNKSSDKSSNKYSNKSSDKSNDKTTDKFSNNSSGDSIKYKFKKNSFFEELSDLVFLNFREIKDCLIDYINCNDGLLYLKELSRFHKKLQRDLNNLLLEQNLDNLLSDDLIKLICKKFNINIIIVNSNCNIYKIYKINSEDFYIFNTFKNDKNNRNYKYIKAEKDISLLINNKIEYISEKEIKKMNIDELRKLSSKLKINKKLKIDIINEIVNTFNKF
jgi:hypothetical protein